MTKIARNDSRPTPRRAIGSPCPLLLAAASLGCAALRPPLTCPEKGGPPWTKLTSRHFVLQTDTAPAVARAVLTEFDGIYSSLGSVMHQPASSRSDRCSPEPAAPTIALEMAIRAPQAFLQRPAEDGHMIRGVEQGLPGGAEVPRGRARPRAPRRGGVEDEDQSGEAGRRGLEQAVDHQRAHAA